MDPQTVSNPLAYHVPNGGAGKQEGSRTPDLHFFVRFQDPHANISTIEPDCSSFVSISGFAIDPTRSGDTMVEAGYSDSDPWTPSRSLYPPFHAYPQDGPIGTPSFPEYSSVSNTPAATQEHPCVFTPHPIQGMTAGLGCDGQVVRVYGPPLIDLIPSSSSPLTLRREDSRVVVPQHRYRCGTTQKHWVEKAPVVFFNQFSYGVRLIDAFFGNIHGMDDKVDFLFGTTCRTGITIRIHFKGYISSTEVEKRLKSLRENNGRARARSMQILTKDRKHGDPDRTVTKAKFVQELSKRIQWHISDLEKNEDLFPFDRRVGEQWRLGQGRMKVENMVITQLRNVSFGSWTPVICVE